MKISDNLIVLQQGRRGRSGFCKVGNLKIATQVRRTTDKVSQCSKSNCPCGFRFVFVSGQLFRFVSFRFVLFHPYHSTHWVRLCAVLSDVVMLKRKHGGMIVLALSVVREGD